MSVEDLLINRAEELSLRVAAVVFFGSRIELGQRSRDSGGRLGSCPVETPENIAVLLLRTAFARAGRQLGGGIIAGNSSILLIAWRAGAVTPDLVVALVIMSVIMAAVGVLACAAPARRALHVQPTEALRQG